jgi:hypothetical protein
MSLYLYTTKRSPNIMKYKREESFTFRCNYEEDEDVEEEEEMGGEL